MNPASPNGFRLGILSSRGARSQGRARGLNIARSLAMGITMTFTLATAMAHTTAHAAGKKKHEHGVADLSVAAEGLALVIEFSSPALEIYGFERPPKSDAEKQKQKDALELLRTKGSELIVLDPSKGCTFKTSTADAIALDAKHTEVRARYSVECKTSPVASKVAVDFKKHFPAIRTLRLQLLVDGSTAVTGATSGGETRPASAPKQEARTIKPVDSFDL